jgi:hypothetical protein
MPSPGITTRGVDLVEFGEQRGPLEHAEGPARLRQVHAIGLVHDILGRHRDLGIAGEHGDLELAGALELEDVVERLGNAGAHDEQPVVAQDHRVVSTQIADQSLPLIEVDCHALVVVVADLREAHRRLRER